MAVAVGQTPIAVRLVAALDDRERCCDGKCRHRHGLPGLGLGHQLAGPEELVLVERALWQLGVGEPPRLPERPEEDVEPGPGKELEGGAGRQPVVGGLGGRPEVLVGREVDLREPELNRNGWQRRRWRVGCGDGIWSDLVSRRWVDIGDA